MRHDFDEQLRRFIDGEPYVPLPLRERAAERLRAVTAGSVLTAYALLVLAATAAALCGARSASGMLSAVAPLPVAVRLLGRGGTTAAVAYVTGVVCALAVSQLAA